MTEKGLLKGDVGLGFLSFQKDPSLNPSGRLEGVGPVAKLADDTHIDKSAATSMMGWADMGA